jgi:ABC-type lipoprotein release transport system permease subunit
MALGAPAAHIVRLVLGGSLATAAVGIAIGIAMALWLGRYVEPLLFETSARDPGVFAAGAVMLLGVAAAATLVPSRRAQRIDAIEALRVEH